MNSDQTKDVRVLIFGMHMHMTYKNISFKFQAPAISSIFTNEKIFSPKNKIAADLNFSFFFDN